MIDAAAAQEELDTVAGVLAKVIGKSPQRCRAFLIAASERPGFQVTDILLKLEPAKAQAFMVELRAASPWAMSWFLLDCGTTERMIR